MPKAESVHSTKINAKSNEVSTDPIFDLIEIHRNACTAHIDAIEELNRIQAIHGFDRGDWITEKPCRDENEAFETLVGAAVNTVPGLPPSCPTFKRSQKMTNGARCLTSARAPRSA